jgi:hypothetical protein
MFCSCVWLPFLKTNDSDWSWHKILNRNLKCTAVCTLLEITHVLANDVSQIPRLSTSWRGPHHHGVRQQLPRTRTAEGLLMMQSAEWLTSPNLIQIGGEIYDIKAECLRSLVVTARSTHECYISLRIPYIVACFACCPHVSRR